MMAGVSIVSGVSADGKSLSVASINLASSGSVIAGVAGQTIRVYRLYLGVNTITNTVQFTDGTTNFNGTMTLLSGSLVLPFDGTPYFTCGVGNPFTLTLGGGQTGGTVYFTQQ